MEDNHSYGKGIYSTNTRSNAKNIPSSWANQQSMSYRSNNQPLKSPSVGTLWFLRVLEQLFLLKSQGNWGDHIMQFG